MTTPNTNTRPTQTTLPSNIKPLVTALAACFAFAASPALAATYTVTNTNDSGAGSLRDVISNSANGNGTGDTIIFAAGLNGQTVTLTSDQINITDTASLIIDASALAGGITLSGNNASRIFGVTEPQALTLNNLTLTQGRTAADTTTPTPDCADLATFNNGGAICAEGILVLINSTVSGNSTTEKYASGGGFFANGDTTLTNSTVSGNSTAGSYAYGGGFFANGDTTLTNSTVSRNSTTGSYAFGGGFFANGDTTLTNSTVSSNSTTGDRAFGGGFFANNDATLNNSTVSGNSTTGDSASGGGFFANGDTTLTNSTVSGNSTAGSFADGGGFFARGATTLSNSTVSQNQAQHATATGDGVFVPDSADTLTLNSSILSGNGTDNFASNNNPTVAVNRSLFGDTPGEVDSSTFSILNNNNPGLAPLANNSGCTLGAGAPGKAMCVQVHALFPDSPALDAGDDNGFATDQRGVGFPRVVGGQADMGAVEGLLLPPTPILPPNPLGECDGVAGINIQDVICTINKVLNP